MKCDADGTIHAYRRALNATDSSSTIRRRKDVKCLLCERKAVLRTYIYGDTFEEALIPLCQAHYGAYMAHGINRLDEIMKGRRKDDKAGSRD